MNNKENILVIGFSYLHVDGRILRQLQCLRKKYNLYVVGYSDPEIKDVKWVKISPRKKKFTVKLRDLFLLLFRRYDLFYKEWPDFEVVVNKLKIINFKVVIVNDFEPLFLAEKVVGERKIILDAHEYSFSQYENIIVNYLLNPLRKWTLFCFSKKIIFMTTVGYEISKLYKKLLPEMDVYVVRNIPEYSEVGISKHNGKIRLVHHGLAIRHRGLENYIDIIDKLGPDFELHFYLVSNHSKKAKKFIADLKEKASKVEGLIVFHDPVAPDMIINEINQYDIGLALIWPTTLSYTLCLPNKFFEFIQSRLAIVSGPTPDIKYLIDKYNVGEVSKTFEIDDIVTSINKIVSNGINIYKQNSNKASGILNSKNELKNFLELVEGIEL